MERARIRALRVIAIAGWLLLAISGRDALAQTWTGAGADNNWSTGANWSGGVAPVSGATTAVIFGNSARTSPVVDVPWTVNSITFGTSPGSATPAYHLTGQPITLAGASPTITWIAGVIGPPGAIIDNPIVLSTSAAIASVSGINVTGGISGPGSLTLTGFLGPVISGTNTFTGGTTVAGQVALNGTMLGPVSVTGGVFGASGTINGPVTVSGAVFPVLDAGNLTTGNLVLGGTFTIGIRGPTQGTQYGVAHVNGTVNVSGSLQVGNTYVPVVGDVFTIIDNDGVDPIVGTFTSIDTMIGGLPSTIPGPVPEGTTFPFNGATLRISYVGGTGNDVTLTTISGAAPVAPAAVPTLSQWMLMLLSGITLVFGMRAMVRRR
jgi:hypothetical protein